jgi:flagellar motor switch protein FliN/FliY
MPENTLVKTAPAGAVAPVVDQFKSLSDVTCEVAVVLGTGRMSVRECLYLKPKTVIPLEQPAGADLHVRINGVLIAHGEVAIVDDSTNVRLTSIVPPPSGEDA